MTAENATNEVQVHGMAPGSHEQGKPTCLCGAEWGRWTDTCAAQILEDLVELARKIDEARKAANAIEVVAGTDHVYGHLSNALYKVLKTITGSAATADLVYNSIAFDGNTVDEAFAWMKTNQA